MRGLTYGTPNVNWLITADLHLTDRPQDAYRFGLFPWMAKQQEEYDITATFILGDLTDRKDNHSATLVNKIVDNLLLLKPPIYILQGNHDAFDRGSPFFKFLNCVEGIEFITEPRLLPELEVAMIPHYPTQESFDEACKQVPHTWAVFMHACLNGAESETGTRLSGLNSEITQDLMPRLWLCGDIHKPQMLECGAVYVGAPYHVRFGDAFTPRLLLYYDNVGTWPTGKNLFYPCLRKWALTIQDPNDLYAHHELHEGDQVKVKVWLRQEKLVDWPTIRTETMRVCKARGLEVFDVELLLQEPVVTPHLKLPPLVSHTPKNILERFCRSEGITENLAQVGMDLLNVQH